MRQEEDGDSGIHITRAFHMPVRRIAAIHHSRAQC